VDELVATWREKIPVIGVSVVLVADGEVAWATGFGTADHEADRAARGYHRPRGRKTAVLSLPLWHGV